MRLIIIIFLFSFNANGQIVRCSPFYISSANNLFLDLYPSATVAFSLRKLNSSYAGNCIRVRRSSDNAEQNIGFVNNYLDTATLKSFVGTTGTSNGFVTTWYDQSGNSNNITQVVAGTQPKIIVSGVVNRYNGIVSILTATNLYLSTSSVLFNGGTFSFISAIGSHATAISGFYGNRNGSTGWASYYVNSPSGYTFATFATSGAAVASISLAQQAKHIEFLTRVSTTNSLWVNNVNTATGSGIYTSTTGGFYVGRAGASTGTIVNTNGYFYEVIGYSSDQTSNRTAMQNNLNSYYSIY